MKFRPVYYMISGWPSLEKTREMVRRYVEHGVTALQFDMPGADPSRESAFIQQGMRHARALRRAFEKFAHSDFNLPILQSLGIQLVFHLP